MAGSPPRYSCLLKTPKKKEASTGESGGDSHPRTAALSQEVTYQVTGDSAAGS